MFSNRFAALAAVVLLLIGIPLSAEDGLDDARDRREQIAKESAQTAAELDVLVAEDAEIVAALAELDSYIAIQEADLADAEQELVTRTEAVETARAQAALLDSQIADLEADIIDRSVETYIGSRAGPGTVLSTEDINDAAVMRFLAEDVSGITTDMTDLLRLAKDQQEQAVAEAATGAAQAQALQEQIAQQLTELETSRAAQLTLKSEVEARIADLESQTQALAREDQAIAAFILGEEQARAAQAAEETRIAEEREAENRAREAAEEEERKRREAEEDANRENNENEPPAPTPTAAPTATPTPGVVLPVTPGDGQVEPGQTPNFIWPHNAPVVSPYGNRVHPIYGTVRFHSGLDIDAPAGDLVWAAAGGEVIFSGWRDGYGHTVIVDHGGGYTSLYAHFATLLVSEGQSVSAGTHVGTSGMTGTATGEHVHFEIRINGETVNPRPYLP